jgi:hypothetical protein
MSIPHVVNESYVRSIGLRDPSRLYVLMAPNVWVIERRLTAMEMLLLGDFEVRLTRLTSRLQGRGTPAVTVKDLSSLYGSEVRFGQANLLSISKVNRRDRMRHHTASGSASISWSLRNVSASRLSPRV